MTIVEDIITDKSLDAAYEWLCHRRKDYPDHADVWSLRVNWPKGKAHIQCDLLTECYQFESLSVVTNQARETLPIWSARDALVLKALTIALHRHRPVSKRCVHVADHGGANESRLVRVVGALTEAKIIARIVEHHDSRERHEHAPRSSPVLPSLWDSLTIPVSRP